MMCVAIVHAFIGQALTQPFATPEGARATANLPIKELSTKHKALCTESTWSRCRIPLADLEHDRVRKASGSSVASGQVVRPPV